MSRVKISSRVQRAAMLVLLSGLGLLGAGRAQAQNPASAIAETLARSAASPQGADPVSSFGRGLSNAEAGALLAEIRQLTEQALAASRAAEQASSVDEIEAGADRVFEVIWGLSSGMARGEGAAEVPSHGWKERWQVTGAEFAPEFVQRLGANPPQITDPRQLGIVGRARAVRGRLEEIASGSGVSEAERRAAENTIASLNNVIGWTYITVGFKGPETQPRISLTHVWDAPTEFWNSTADTGWLHEVHAQAVNILKTNYEGDVAEAREHAAGMTSLLTRVIEGLDVDEDGLIEPKMMEGGLTAALAEAAGAGIRSN